METVCFHRVSGVQNIVYVCFFVCPACLGDHLMLLHMHWKKNIGAPLGNIGMNLLPLNTGAHQVGQGSLFTSSHVFVPFGICPASLSTRCNHDTTRPGAMNSCKTLTWSAKKHLGVQKTKRKTCASAQVKLVFVIFHGLLIPMQCNIYM